MLQILGDHTSQPPCLTGEENSTDSYAVRSSVTLEELGVEPLLLHIERSQLEPPEHLPRKVVWGLQFHQEETPEKTQDTQG